MEFLFSGRGLFKGHWHTLFTKRGLRAVPITKVLVANRGEIACRVMRTAKKMGVQTVAVYSDADRNAMHVTMADEAYRIGPAPSRESYLRQDMIVNVAKRTGCQAIHPGYGFLSENAEFAERCEEEGLVFVGPPASAIRDMGIKSASKRIMAEAGVPVVPGYHGEEQSDERLLEEARRIGFPLMIKAVQGGGGKGMRIANSEEEFGLQLASARREAKGAFGDESMLLEAYVSEPRHVEVQVFADMHGNTVHLFERDCSLQRRHQKVLEEAPAPGLSAELRQELGAAAVRAAQAVGYVGAGTVEFIMDRHSLAFHFMEMNTRLQVEHPVTEMVTGTDLVAWQLKTINPTSSQLLSSLWQAHLHPSFSITNISQGSKTQKVASGQALPLRQEDIALRGHALEARVYAEAPRRGFLPGAGPLRFLRQPPCAADSTSDTRVETGVRQGDDVSVHYDPMIAKLVVWADDRAAAVAKMRQRLADYKIVGLETNVEFLMDVCSQPDFLAGQVHTAFIPQHEEELLAPRTLPDQALAQVAVGVALQEKLQAEQQAVSAFNPYAIGFGFRVNHELVRKIPLLYESQEVEAEVTYKGLEGKFMVRVGTSAFDVEASMEDAGDGGLELRTSIGGDVETRSTLVLNGSEIHLFTQDGAWQLERCEPKYLKELGQGSGSTERNSGGTSPMPGIVDKVLVAEGQVVEAGEPLSVVIAMKMEYVVKSPRKGLVEKVLVRPGQSVTKGTVLVSLKEEEEAKEEVQA